MGFGGFMIGFIGYGAGICCLINAGLALKDAGVARSKGKSEDGKTHQENLHIMGRSVLYAFGCFVVTWLILKI